MEGGREGGREGRNGEREGGREGVDGANGVGGVGGMEGGSGWKVWKGWFVARVDCCLGFCLDVCFCLMGGQTLGWRGTGWWDCFVVDDGGLEIVVLHVFWPVFVYDMM